MRSKSSRQFAGKVSSEERLFLKETKGLEEFVNGEEFIVVFSDYTTGRRLTAAFPQRCELVIEDGREGGVQHFYDHEQRDDIKEDFGVHWSFYNVQTLVAALSSIHRRLGGGPLRKREKALALQEEWTSFLSSYATEDPDNPVVVLMPLADYYENIAKAMSAGAEKSLIQIFTAKELDQRMYTLQNTDRTLAGCLFFEKKL
ncbi:MAG: hypothetical protein ACPGC9_02545 [Cytophagales bacterium]